MPIVQLIALDAITRPATSPPPPRIVARPQSLQLGTNQMYTRWEFQTDTIESIYWQIPTFDPALDTGEPVTFRLLWAPGIAGTAAWRVSFVSRADGETYDIAPATERNLDAVSAGGFPALTISPLVITAAIPPAEIAPGERVTVVVRREAQAAADTIDGESAFLLGASLEYSIT